VIVHITRATRLLLFWSLIIAAILLSATRIFLAEIEHYRIELEQKIRQTTDIPVRIGKLDAGMRGFDPEIILHGISVDTEEAAHRPQISLREIRLGIDFVDLLLTRDPLSASRVTLVGADLEVIRNQDGSFSIKGLQDSDEQPVWLLKGGKFEILDSRVSWLDMKRHGEPVHFDRIDLLIKNDYFDHSHEVHLLSNLPYQYGDTLRISARFTGDVFTADDIDGVLYLEGTDLQAGALITGDLPLGLDLQAGAGDVRVWSYWRQSRVYQVAGYVQGQQIKIRRNQDKALAVDTLEASFTWSDNGERWRLAGYDVNIVAAGQRWPQGAFYLQQNTQGDLSAYIKHLDLPAAMHIAPLLLPTGQRYADALILNPKGRLNDVSVFVGSDLTHYALRGNFAGLGIEQWKGLPQIQELSGRIDLTDQYGGIVFNTRDAGLYAPAWFRKPLALSRLQGTLHWWQGSDSWQFYSPSLAVDSPDLSGVGRMNLLLPKDEASPILDLTLAFGHFGDISKVPLYLPAKIMGQGAVEWLDDAFVAGHIKKGELVVQGSLDQFPFENGSGRFETVFAIEDGEIQFNQDWPHLKGVYADVQFLAGDLQVSVVKGYSERVDIDQAVVTIPDLANGDHVYVWGQVHAKAAESLSYLQKSPLKAKIDPIAELVDVSGLAHVDLDLKIPYYETDPVKAKVTAHLNGAQLTVKPIALKVDDIRGRLIFTEDSSSSSRLDARALGYPIQGRLSSDDAGTYLKVDGSTSVDRLQTQFSYLKNRIAEGKFNYSTHLKLPSSATSPTTLKITSSLKGVTIDSPLGLAKSVDENRLLNVDFQFEEDTKLPLQIRYADKLHAYFLVDKANNSLYSGHIVLGKGQADRYAKAGLNIEVHQATFDLTQALDAFNGGATKQGPELNQISVKTKQLIWKEQDLGTLDCHAQYDDNAWSGRIDSKMAKGVFRIPKDHTGSNRISLAMDYLNLSAMDAINLNAANEAVSELPLIDIDSRRILWRSVDLGALKLETERLVNGVHFKQIHLHSANSKIDLTGDWLTQASGTATQLKGTLQTENFGALLSRLDYTDDIKETSGTIGFKGGWPGGPHQFSIGSLSGQLQLDLHDGRISSIEPGIGRLLGLLAMEQWVKRLSLDFSDLYRQGLAFDEIKGRIKIRDGLAFTDDLTVDAVAAKFYLAGYANLNEKTLDQRVAVVPKSTDAVPIAGTIVGGIASMITQAVTGDYREGYFFGSQYKVFGNWGNIEVSPLHDKDGLVNKTWRGLTDFGWLDAITE
jgi:uncharacterized protein (TIGR02099 family)